MNRGGKWLLGLFVILLGVGVVVSSVGNIPVFFPGWWTLFLIVPAVAGMINDRRISYWNGGLFLAGAVLLLSKLQAAYHFLGNFNLWTVVWGLIIIYVGIGVMFGFGNKTKIVVRSEETDDGDTFDYEVTFGEMRRKNTSRSLNGGEIKASFGKCTVDLSEAECTHPIIITVEASFSEVDVIAPRHNRLSVKQETAAGSVNCTAPRELDVSLAEVTFDCKASFGAVNIR